MTDRYDRALGALTGLALGDALGMPTQLLPRQRILDQYGVLTWALWDHHAARACLLTRHGSGLKTTTR